MSAVDTRESVEAMAGDLEWQAEKADRSYPEVFSIDSVTADEAAAMLRRLLDRTEAAERERDEHQSSFNIRWQADMRAIKRWQAESKGRDLKWPDHVDLVCWLAEQLATARADALREAAGAIRGSIKVQLQIVDPHVARFHAHERYRDVREIYAAAVENLIHPTTTGET